MINLPKLAVYCQSQKGWWADKQSSFLCPKFDSHHRFWIAWVQCTTPQSSAIMRMNNSASVGKLLYYCLNGTEQALLTFFVELMSHLSHVKQQKQSINRSHTWIYIVCTNIKRKGTFKWRFHGEESLLAPSFESVTFRPRLSSICSRTFLTGLWTFSYALLI